VLTENRVNVCIVNCLKFILDLFTYIVIDDDWKPSIRFLNLSLTETSLFFVNLKRRFRPLVDRWHCLLVIRQARLSLKKVGDKNKVLQELRFGEALHTFTTHDYSFCNYTFLIPWTVKLWSQATLKQSCTN
jgi:hypothetical protein